MFCATGYFALLIAALNLINEVIRRCSPEFFQSLGSYSNCVSELILVATSVLLMLVFLRGRFPGFIRQTGLTSKEAPLDLVKGIAIGMVVVATMFGAMFVLNAYSIQSINWPINLIAPLILYFLAGLSEELIFRGFIFSILEKGCSTLVAVFGSSLLFGFAHFLNPSFVDQEFGYVAYACALLSLEAGLPFSGAYLIARRLWLPIGFHWTWNVLEGTVFGAVVSGTESGPSVFASRVNGDTLLTGGVFGPEASLPFFVVGVVYGTLLLLWAYKKGRWRPIESTGIVQA